MLYGSKRCWDTFFTHVFILETSSLLVTWQAAVKLTHVPHRSFLGTKPHLRKTKDLCLFGDVCPRLWSSKQRAPHRQLCFPLLPQLKLSHFGRANYRASVKKATFTSTGENKGSHFAFQTCDPAWLQTSSAASCVIICSHHNHKGDTFLLETGKLSLYIDINYLHSNRDYFRCSLIYSYIIALQTN